MRDSHVTTTKATSAILYWGSLAWYYQRYFKVNKSVPLFVGFAAGSYIAAGEWSKFLLLPVLTEAAVINNMNEEKHKNATSV